MNNCGSVKVHSVLNGWFGLQSAAIFSDTLNMAFPDTGYLAFSDSGFAIGECGHSDEFELTSVSLNAQGLSGSEDPVATVGATRATGENISPKGGNHGC